MNNVAVFSVALLVGIVAFTVSSTEPGNAAQKPTLAQQLAAKPAPRPLGLDTHVGVAKGNTSSSLNTTAKPAVTGSATPQNKQAVINTTTTGQKAAIISRDGAGIVSHDSGGFRPK